MKERLISSINPYYFFSQYKKSVKNKHKRFNITRKQHSKILRLAHELISKGMIEDKFIFNPPYLACKFRVKRYKQPIKYDENGKIIKSNLPVDWKSTLNFWKINPQAKEEKKLIYYLNDHSDGYRYTFSKFKKRYCNNKNLKYFSFLATRTNNRALKDYILNPLNNIEYYE
jgi:hypothetical protein